MTEAIVRMCKFVYPAYGERYDTVWSGKLKPFFINGVINPEFVDGDVIFVEESHIYYFYYDFKNIKKRFNVVCHSDCYTDIPENLNLWVNISIQNFKHLDKLIKNIDILKVYQYDKKVRCGVSSDGGYVFGITDNKYDCYISAGVSSEESFSRDFINSHNLNKNCAFAFDGTIADYPYRYTDKITFFKKNIDNYNDDKHTDLTFLTNSFNNIFLKMDIEGGEYPWLLSLSEDSLKKFKQIVLEVHGVTNDDWDVSSK